MTLPKLPPGTPITQHFGAPHRTPRVDAWLSNGQAVHFPPRRPEPATHGQHAAAWTIDRRLADLRKTPSKGRRAA